MKKQKSRRSKTRKSNRKSAVIIRGGNEGCAVILAYKDGEKFIKEQLESVHRQTYDDFHIYIHDDASNLPFTTVMNRQALPAEKTTIHTRKKNVGVTPNFLQGLEACGSEHAYYAFCDQDDIWNDDKLERAVTWLARHTDGPALYCANTIDVNAAGGYLRHSKPLSKKIALSFAEALVSPLPGGHTMVMNGAARNLLLESALNTEVAIHDWWCYILFTGTGAHITFESEPCLRGRLHTDNVTSPRFSFVGLLNRIHRHAGGQARRWNDMNVAALERQRHLLTPENRAILDRFTKARQSWLVPRLHHFHNAGIRFHFFERRMKVYAMLLLNRL